MEAYENTRAVVTRFVVGGALARPERPGVRIRPSPAAISLAWTRFIYGKTSSVALDMVDASALLWRLYLRSVDVGDRFRTLADNWMPIATARRDAFNDIHAVMAFVGANRSKAADTVLEAQRLTMDEADDNAAFTREVGHPVALAIKAFGDGNYAETIRLLRPIRSYAHRFGGSHAQRDVINLTLIEAAARSGRDRLAQALRYERTGV